MKVLTLALIGAGGRGKIYTDFAIDHPDKFKVVAVADPVDAKREHIAKLHGISEDKCFKSWEEMLSQPKMADIAIISTQDKEHFAPAMKAISLKYDLLLEKPISPSPYECYEISKAAKEQGVKVIVCHVLRYTQFYNAIKKVIDDGRIGEIMNINHIECVGNVHNSHSYVRGNWRNEKKSAPMILAKSCHDVDLMQWLIGEPCTKVQSFGELSYFREENAPEGAPAYCLDGCPHKDSCFYYAPDLYKRGEWAYCLIHNITNKFEPSDEEILEGLKSGPYGRCVFRCDNDVVDHQTLNLQFGKNKYVTFTMSAFNRGGRFTNIMGTKGEITASMFDSSITLFDFATKEFVDIMSPDKDFDDTISGGHGGGDQGIMMDLYEYIANDKPSKSISDVSVSAENHLIAFAAECSRLSGTVVDMEDYKNSL